MDLLLILTYTALCVAVFKVSKFHSISGQCPPQCSAA